MLKKGHALALAVTTAGLIGLSAPIASAATTAVAPHNHGGLVNVSNNQVPVQGCGNDVDLNGAGGQVTGQGGALVGSLLSPGAFTNATAVNNRGCEMANKQTSKGRHSSNDGGLANVANNQVPAQFCGNQLMGNVFGGQVPLSALSGALAVLSPFAITNSTAVNNQGCALANSQHG
jgi:hypothetical protein